jgi:hypothetical protein
MGDHDHVHRGDDHLRSHGILLLGCGLLTRVRRRRNVLGVLRGKEVET